MQDLSQDLSQDQSQHLSNQPAPASQPPTLSLLHSENASIATPLRGVRNTSPLPPDGIREAAESISATHFWEVDEARFMRTGGRRHYRVKGVDARVAISGPLVMAFMKDGDQRPEEVWWALANSHFDSSPLERGAVALLKRKNELLEVVRTIHALMPSIELAARQTFESIEQGAA